MFSWKSFDFFQKADSEAKVTSATGGAVTIVSMVFIAILVLNETVDYFHVNRVETVGVDRSFGEKMNINIDITFPNSACRLVYFDVVDSTGEEQIAIDDLKKITVPNKAAKLGEGCRVKGELHVNKVNGNFHFALGKGVPNTATGDAMSTDPFATTMVGAQHQHRFDMYELQMFNASHVIKRLSVGKEYPGMPKQPLDGMFKYVESGLGQYNYYLSVVPTVYTKINGQVIKSAQYTYTQKIVEVESTAVRFPHPGAFFFLNISPLLIQIKEEHTSFLRYFTNICAIVGSVWIVSMLIESLVSSVLGGGSSGSSSLSLGGNMNGGAEMAPLTRAAPAPLPSLASFTKAAGLPSLGRTADKHAD